MSDDDFDMEDCCERVRALSPQTQRAFLDLLDRWDSGLGPYADEEAARWVRSRALILETCAGRA